MGRGNLTAAQRDALRSEVRTDPLGRGYADLAGEGAVLADLTAARYPGECRVTILTIANRCGSEIAARLAGSMQGAATANPLIGEMLAVSRSGEGIDVNHPDSRAMLGGMAANAELPLTADDAAAVVALADNLACRLDVLGLPVPRIREIRQAREA